MAKIYFNKHVLTVNETYNEITNYIEYSLINGYKFIYTTEKLMVFDESEQKMSKKIKGVFLNIDSINYVTE